MRIALLLSALLMVVAALPAQAQTYGSGMEVNVPWVEDGAITIDGEMNEAAWSNAAEVDAAANWDGEWTGHPDPDIGIETKLLYTNDKLYVFHRVSDYAVMTDPYTDHVLLGLDFIHEAGVTDRMSDDGFSGFPDNFPDGPLAYKIFPGNDTIPAFSVNFGTDTVPADSGWVDGVFFFDENTLEWGFEAVFQNPLVDVGSKIGFNIGGAAAKEEGIEDREGEAPYAYYSWSVCDTDAQPTAFFCGPGGTVMSDAHSLGTLNLLGPNADTYGTGVEVDVQWVEPGTITLDGKVDEAAWEQAVEIDATANWDGEWTGHPDADIGVETRVLYTQDTLFVFHRISDYALLMDPYADHVLLGLDFLHEAGITDVQIDEDFGGFVENAPDGPFVYKIFAGTETIPAFSLNFGEEIDAMAEGWVDGTFFVDETTLEWGFEAAFVHDNVGPGGAVGFNIGGGAAKEEGIEDREGEAPYAYYSWQVCDPDVQPTAFFCGAGGTVMSDAHSLATLNLVAPGGSDVYGTGVSVTVPRVAPGTIQIDGQMNESVWEKAAEVDATANWDGEWTGHPDADIGVETRLLYTDDALYVFHRISDYAVMFEPYADHVLLGLDFLHEAGVTDRMSDDGFSGFPDNFPDGPMAYKIFAGNDTIPAFSVNFGTDVDPMAEGWVDGAFFFDENTLEWGFEAAFMHDNVSEGNEIGFNIGGGAAKEEGIDDREGEAPYAYYSWQVCDPDAQPTAFFCGAGGTVMSDAHSLATLVLGASVGIEQEKLDELPAQYALGQNYPNPFNPSTTIEFSIGQAGSVSLDVFNLLGQHVTSLLNEPKTAGTYRLSWEAGNLSSGMYVYQLRVDGKLIQSRKMMLLK